MLLSALVSSLPLDARERSSYETLLTFSIDFGEFSLSSFEKGSGNRVKFGSIESLPSTRHRLLFASSSSRAALRTEFRRGHNGVFVYGKGVAVKFDLIASRSDGSLVLGAAN